MLELIEKKLQCSSVLCLEQVRSVFESKIILPDDFSEIQTILSVNSTNKTAFVHDRGLTPTIILDHTLLYTSTQENTNLISYTFTTEHPLDLNLSAFTDMDCLMLNVFVEHTDFTLENSHSITLRCIVRSEPRIFFTQNQDIIENISGEDDLQIKQGLLPVTNLVLLPEIVTEIKNDIILPSGKKSVSQILQKETHISDITVATEDGTATVKGTISVFTLYLGDGDNITPETLENHFPFTCNMNLPTLDSQLVFKNCRITDFDITIKEDEDGECRILSTNILLSLSIICSEYQESTIVTDAFSLSKKINFTTTPVKISRHISNVDDQFVLKDIAQKPEDAPEIEEIINVSGAVGHLDSQISDGKISLDGFVSCKVLYMTQDSKRSIAAFNIEIPFLQKIDNPHAETNLLTTLAAEVVHISFCIISSEEIELRLALHVSGTITNDEEHFTISNIVEEPLSEVPKQNRPSILIYVVQPGDTLWEIAKHYATSPSTLQSLNNVKSPENLVPGQKLIIA